MPERLSAPFFALVITLLGGCGGGGGAPPAPASCAAATISQCVASQKACAADAEGDRCVDCPAGQYAAVSGSCEAIDGAPLSHDFSEFTVKPGEEVLGLCQSWTLNNPAEIWVSAVELTQDDASHHSNWTFVPDDQYAGPDGVWKCDDRNYSQLDAALVGGVLYAQSTQAAHEVQHFPNGAAVRIPPYARIIGDVHLLNTGQDAVTGHVKLTVYDLPKADVKVKLVPFHLDYLGLDLPPHAASRFTGDCAVGKEMPGGTLGFSLYYALPHTHALATRFFLSAVGGKHDQESLIEVDGFTKEAHGRAYDPPIDLHDATGLRFGCQYENPRAVEVKWGFGDQEMCEVLGFIDGTRAFESDVPNAVAAGQDTSVQLFTGDCSTTSFPWDNSKPGGPGPM
jgi:hypothetical protein